MAVDGGERSRRGANCGCCCCTTAVAPAAAFVEAGGQGDNWTVPPGVFSGGRSTDRWPLRSAELHAAEKGETDVSLPEPLLAFLAPCLLACLHACLPAFPEPAAPCLELPGFNVCLFQAPAQLFPLGIHISQFSLAFPFVSRLFFCFVFSFVHSGKGRCIAAHAGNVCWRLDRLAFSHTRLWMVFVFIL